MDHYPASIKEKQKEKKKIVELSGDPCPTVTAPKNGHGGSFPLLDPSRCRIMGGSSRIHPNEKTILPRRISECQLGNLGSGEVEQCTSIWA